MSTAPGAALPDRLIWTDGDIAVARGHFGSPPAAVFAVSPCDSAPDAARSGRYSHAFGMRHLLDPAWAAVPLAYLPEQQPHTMVVADPGGELLVTLLRQAWDMGRFLRLAIALARALGQLHGTGLVHRDIKPLHLLIDEARGRAWIGGYSLALTADQARDVAPAARIAGTWAYMAPEQTGRLQRPIDARSDLYGLGVTLYEVLAGMLPFTASEPSEWIHCHMARLARAPEEARGVPATVVSDIILALLAKDPQDRYQSAGALEADLRRCLADWVATGTLLPFPLARRERGGQVVAPQRLYGRERELLALDRALARARGQQSTELMFIAAYSGCGKSALVAAWQKQGLPSTLWAGGKFDQYKRDIPYSTLAQICDSLVAQVLALPALEVADWRERLQQALGEHASLLVDIAPSLAQLTADGPAPHGAPADFHVLLCRFLQVFARGSCPLIVFLDDVQWIDAATLRFIESLVVGNEVRHLLLIAACRDNEIDAAHPLQRALGAMRAVEARVETLALQPLEVADLEQLVGDALQNGAATGPPPTHVPALARLLKTKTDGNPFFVILFLNALIDDGLLGLDPASGSWQADLARIEARGLTDNVIELMAARLRRLSPACQRLLGRFACLGHAAPRAVLALVLHLPPAHIDAALWEAFDAGLVQCVDEVYAFLHDRVQEAAHGVFPAAERAAIHADIGRLLYAFYPGAQRDEHIFEIANQVDRGLHLVEPGGERAVWAAINLAAGERARRSTAHAAALNYFAAGCALIDAALWRDAFALAFELHLRRGEAEFLTGELAAAEATLAALALRAVSVVDRAAVAWMQITLLTAAGQLDRAIDICLSYLARVDVQWPAAPSRAEVMREYAPIAARIHMGAGAVESLLALPDLADAEIRATMEVLVAVLPPAFFTNEDLVCLVLCRLANMSMRHGHTDASALGYAYLGMMLGPYFGQYDAGYRFGQLGHALVETGRFERFKARVYMCFAYHVMPWTRHIRDGVDLLRRAYDEAHEAGDLTYGGFSSCTLVTSLLAASEPLREVQQEAEAKLALVRRSRFDLVASIIATQVQLVRALRGLTADVGSFDDALISEAQFETHLAGDPSLSIARCWYAIRKLQAHCIAGDYPAALRAAQQAAPLLWSTSGHFELAEYHFYAALARARCAGSAPDCSAERADHLAALAAHAAQLALWAGSGPANFACRASLIDAERARLAGQPMQALRLFEAAIGAAQRERFCYVEALAAELAAQLCLAEGLASPASAFLAQAQAAWRVWGADGKVRQLDAIHPQLRVDKPAPPPTVTMGTRLDALDLAAMVKIAEVISGEISLDRLIATLMAVVLEHSGAQRALLILPKPDQWWVEGEATAGSEAMAIHRPHLPLAQLNAPADLIYQVIRERAAIVIDDAQADHPFADDRYFAVTQSRSVFCFPLLKQARIIGIVYLENALAPQVFTSARRDLLTLMASPAAVSLQNAEQAQALRDDELRWRTMTEALPHLIWTVGADGVSDYFSPQCCRYLGVPESQIIGMDVWLGSLHPDDRQRCAGVWQAAFAAEARYDVEMRLRRHDGVYLWFHSVAVPVRDSQGRVARWFGTSTDISARKLAETAMIEAKMAAESANHAKNRFLANISHELRTPLNGILGYAQILRGDGTMNERQQDGINVIEQSGEYLLALINDILDFSRIEARKLDLEIADVPLEKFMRVIVDIMGMRAREKGIELVCNLPPSLPHAIRADERRLRQVLLNLLANAVRFTDYGEVRLALEFMAPDRLQFSIADTGIGIAADSLEAIFRPFEQAGELPRRTGGAGLGLAISRQLVRLMGADILVCSEVGVGSMFWFELRVGEAPGYPARRRDPPVVRGYGGPRRTVLVADDVKANREVVVGMLGALGFVTVEASDGQAALSALASHHIDLILMDAVMPVMDGIDAIRTLKADRRYQAIPVIAISANVSGQNRDKCLQAGAEVFLHKPLNLQALTGQVRSLLGLAWLYDTPGLPDPGAPPAPAPAVYPPRAEIEVLHQLALQGNMRAIVERAAYLDGLDARYRGFAGQLRELARGFQSKATLRLIEQVIREQE